MDIMAATRPVPGQPNDDGYLIGPNFAAVLDGCTDPGLPSGCIHNVPWLVAQLSGHLAYLLSTGNDKTLPQLLSEAISRTTQDHAHTCDLANPNSPSSTVTIIRQTDTTVDYIALGDSPLALLDIAKNICVIIDDQVDHLPSYTYEAVATLRNSAGGFWVASTDPSAAEHAVHGSAPQQGLRQALLVSDGASRLVDRYGYHWEDLFNIAKRSGPLAVIDAVHLADDHAERERLVHNKTRRGKAYDDATAVLCLMPDNAGD